MASTADAGPASLLLVVVVVVAALMEEEEEEVEAAGIGEFLLDIIACVRTSCPLHMLLRALFSVFVLIFGADSMARPSISCSLWPSSPNFSHESACSC